MAKSAANLFVPIALGKITDAGFRDHGEGKRVGIVTIELSDEESCSEVWPLLGTSVELYSPDARGVVKIVPSGLARGVLLDDGVSDS